jgi:hypothetical protein
MGRISYWGYFKGVQFLFGGRQRGRILNWGYTEEYNFDLVVFEYKKVENP